ncbi:MAG: SDR family oxidoreductase [Deltaproteobacteria bacterium]|nr:SDR family oxidoreductase [Deltaproteobacteria bacterium]
MGSNQKVAVVTGAGTGIGRATALALLKEGYRVVLVGRRAELLEKAVAEAGAGQRALAVPADVSDPESVRSLFQKTRAAFGRIDLLFNNAGVNVAGVLFEDLTYEQWKSVVDTNLTGMFLCAQAAFRMMKDQEPRGGRIINTGSVSSHVPRPDSAPYTATKHGVTGLTRSISLDGRKYDIACGQIDVGNALTEMSARIATGVKQANGEMAPEPMMDVQNIADAVVLMAGLPITANVQFMTIMATKMPLIGRG